MTTKAQIGVAVVAKLGPIVGSRVHRLVFPQPPALPVWPAIRYSFVSVTVSPDICGDGGEETADYRLQIDVVSAEASGASAFSSLCASVRAAMATLLPTYVWDSEFEDFDAETKTYRLSADYLVYLSSPT